MQDTANSAAPAAVSATLAAVTTADQSKIGLKGRTFEVIRAPAASHPRVPINNFEWGWRGVCPAFALRVEGIVDEQRLRAAVQKLCQLYNPLITARVDAVTQELVLSNEGVALEFAEDVVWEQKDVFEWCTKGNHEFVTDILAGEEGLVSVKCSYLAGSKGSVIGVMANHMYFDGFGFYTLVKNLSALYEGRDPAPVSSLTSARWTDMLKGKGKESVEEAIARGRAKGFTPLMDKFKTNWGTMWHMGSGEQVQFSLAELTSLKSTMNKPGCKPVSSYKAVCAHLTKIYAEMFGWGKVRTFHLLDIRDRVDFFPPSEQGYVGCGVAFYEVEVHNAQAELAEIAADLTKGLSDKVAMAAQIAENLELTAATGMAWFPFTPLAYDDDGFPQFGPDDVPIILYNSHAFKQDELTFDGPVVDLAGWTLCQHIYVPAPSHRAGFDMLCIMPAKVRAVKQAEWEAKIHKFA